MQSMGAIPPAPLPVELPAAPLPPAPEDVGPGVPEVEPAGPVGLSSVASSLQPTNRPVATQIKQTPSFVIVSSIDCEVF
jgi:hypothetical protein